MQTEITTRHGVATVTAANDMTPEQLEATQNAVDALDDFSWRCGAGSASLSAGGAAIKWKLTAETHATINGQRIDLRTLDTAIDNACTMACQLAAAGRCCYFGNDKATCPRVAALLEDEADTDKASSYLLDDDNQTCYIV